MKEKTYTLNTMLIAVLGLSLLAAVLVRAVAPIVIIPPLNIPNMVALSLIALLLDHYIAPGAKRCYICVSVFAALAFGLLPWMACFVDSIAAVKLGVVGGITFAVTTFLYSSIQERLSSGPAAKAAPFMSAFGLFLAAQVFAGMIL